MLKSKDVTLLTKGRIVKAIVFPVVVYKCLIWTMKTEPQRTDVLSCAAGEDP